MVQMGEESDNIPFGAPPQSTRKQAIQTRCANTQLYEQMERRKEREEKRDETGFCTEQQPATC